MTPLVNYLKYAQSKCLFLGVGIIFAMLDFKLFEQLLDGQGFTNDDGDGR